MSFWRNYYHIVWATKKRQALITSEIEPVLFEYIHRKASEFEIKIYAIDGWHDHIHIIAAIPPKHAIASIVKRFKGASSHYLNQNNTLDVDFKWQRGYGVFTLGHSQLQSAINYVQNQKQHHQQQTTNAWLERVDEFDAGPEELMMEKDPAKSIQEERPVYDVPMPF